VLAAVDRRSSRRRDDAARIIEAFTARLRDQVDLDALHGELLAVVDQTMRPSDYESVPDRPRRGCRVPSLRPWGRVLSRGAGGPALLIGGVAGFP
jgi:hypothetical protein